MRFVLCETGNDFDSSQVRGHLREDSIIRPIIRLFAKLFESVELLACTVCGNSCNQKSCGNDVIVSFETFKWHSFGRAVPHLGNESEIPISVSVDVLHDEVHLFVVEVERCQGHSVLTTECFENFSVTRFHIQVNRKEFSLLGVLTHGNHRLYDFDIVLTRGHLIEVNDIHYDCLRLLRELTQNVQHFLKFTHGSFSSL